MSWRTRLPVQNNRPLDIRRTGLVEKLSMSISSLAVKYRRLTTVAFGNSISPAMKTRGEQNISSAENAFGASLVSRNFAFFTSDSGTAARKDGGEKSSIHGGHTDNTIARTRLKRPRKNSRVVVRYPYCKRSRNRDKRNG